MAVSSYGAVDEIVRRRQDCERSGVPVEGRDVLIVEDIIDSGLTLSYLIDVLERRNAQSVTVVTLFDKPAGRTVELEADYTGLALPDAFVVGYGLDYAEKYRNLPYIGVLKAGSLSKANRVMPHCVRAASWFYCDGKTCYGKIIQVA